MQSNFDKRTVHSANLYQIFAYVKNKQIAFERAGESVEVSGMLLYAATDEEVQPDVTYRMSGNQIGVRTVSYTHLVRIESGRQLAALGGSDSAAEAAPRSRQRA